MRKRQVVLKREQQRENLNNNNNNNSNNRYGECQKNHAAKVGGYALDGCREFMASGEDGTDLALVCAACGCHRSFHRRLPLSDDAASRTSSSEITSLDASS